MSNWFYERDKDSIGPIKDVELLELYKKGNINAKTLVWNKAQKNEWKPLGMAGITLPEIERDELSPPPIPQRHVNPFVSFAGRVYRLDYLVFFIVLAVCILSLTIMALGAF